MVQSTSTEFQELLYTQRLAEVDDKVRGNTIKKLKNFLKIKSSTTGFAYDDHLKIWKGLYYCMYMADKPLFQENLAENISQLIHHISDDSQKLLFFRVALDTFAREWSGIDKFRMDKFLMLVTRVLREMLIYLKTTSWDEEKVKETSSILESGIICPFDRTNEKPLSLKIHIADIILEELAKVGRENLPDQVLIAFMIPFFKVLAVCNNNTYVQAVKSHILYALIRQSELGLKNQEDLSIRELELMEDGEADESDHESDEEIQEQDTIMDPRAGGVDVHLPLLRPNYSKVAEALLSVASVHEVPRQKRRLLVKNAKNLSNLSNGKYPFSFPHAEEKTPRSKRIKEAVKSLQEFESDVMRNKRKLSIEDEDEGIISKKIKVSKLQEKNKKKKNIKRMLLLRKKKMQRIRKANKMLRVNVQNQINPNEQLTKKQEIRTKEIMKATSECVLENKLRSVSDGFGRRDNSCVPAPLTAAEKTKIKETSDQKTHTIDISERTKSKKLAKKNAKKLKTKTESVSSSGKDSSSDSVQPKVLNKKTKNSLNSEANISGCVKTKTEFQLKKKNNAKKVKKNAKEIKNMKAVKDEWDEPLEEGEFEFEVTVKKYAKKVRETPSQLKKKFPKVKKSRTLKINLQKNKEHEYKDYKKAVASSPGIPFSAQKKPVASVLKTSKSPNVVRKSCASKINSLKKKYKL